MSKDPVASPTRRRRAREGEAGFTLVEMLVVITIIGMIMALVGPRVLNYLSESKAKAAKKRPAPAPAPAPAVAADKPANKRTTPATLLDDWWR